MLGCLKLCAQRTCVSGRHSQKLANMTQIPTSIKRHYLMVLGFVQVKDGLQIHVQQPTLSKFKHTSHSSKVGETYNLTESIKNWPTNRLGFFYSIILGFTQPW